MKVRPFVQVLPATGNDALNVRTLAYIAEEKTEHGPAYGSGLDRVDAISACMRAVHTLGIANLASGDISTAVTYGAAPTWAKYLEFLANVAGNNALLGQPAYVASVASAVNVTGWPGVACRVLALRANSGARLPGKGPNATCTST